jgi:hypothetical protein
MRPRKKYMIVRRESADLPELVTVILVLTLLTAVRRYCML